MAGSSDFAKVNAALTRLTKELDDPAIAHALGKMGKEVAQREASADLGGDAKFSGWQPYLTTRYKVVDEGGPGALLMPNRRSAGPWTVAERGRNQGGASGFAGPGVNVKTGATARTKSGAVRKVRARKGRRWNGRTAGKGTATRAVSVIDKNAGRVVQVHVGLAIRRARLR